MVTRHTATTKSGEKRKFPFSQNYANCCKPLGHQPGLQPRSKIAVRNSSSTGADLRIHVHNISTPSQNTLICSFGSHAPKADNHQVYSAMDVCKLHMEYVKSFQSHIVITISHYVHEQIRGYT